MKLEFIFGIKNRIELVILNLFSLIRISGRFTINVIKIEFNFKGKVMITLMNFKWIDIESRN